MQKKLLHIAIAITLSWQGATAADAGLDGQSPASEMANPYDPIPTMASEQRQGGWLNNLEIGGLIEVEAAFADPDEGESESSLTLATAELSLGANINPALSAEVVLLYEDDGDEELDVDVAAVAYAPDEHWSAVAGQLYVPFGSFETQMIADPLTLEIGETRETSLLGSYATGPFSISLYLFDGDAQEEETNKIDNFGANLGYGFENDTFILDAALGYINDIGDSDGLIDYAGVVHDRVGGLAFNILVGTGPFTFIAESIASLDEFPTGEEPSAFNIEGGYGLVVADREATLAVGYQGTDDAALTELPEKIFLTAFSIDVTEGAAIGFEYARAEAYDGTRSNNLTIQFAAEF
ncbi:MAG: LbtU family siderophore porin [Candidatus Thiodiazotropha sp. (ex Dulcina madagascariensis)]|nr:LbtU family siderophore porin [Candidatus Thiodiazotropha sp. (ex Dulcina madagascariensis)]